MTGCWPYPASMGNQCAVARTRELEIANRGIGFERAVSNLELGTGPSNPCLKGGGRATMLRKWHGEVANDVHQAFAGWRSSWRHHLQCPHLDTSACEDRRAVSDGGRRDRSRLHRAHRSSGHYSSVGARVWFPWGGRSPQGRKPRSRQKHLLGALSLFAPARQRTTTMSTASGSAQSRDSDSWPS